jgi:hypothetical protein
MYDKYIYVRQSITMQRLTDTFKDCKTSTNMVIVVHVSNGIRTCLSTKRDLGKVLYLGSYATRPTTYQEKQKRKLDLL